MSLQPPSRRVASCALALLAVALPIAAAAAPDGDDAGAVMRAAYDRLEAASSVEIRQTVEQASTVMGTPQNTTQSSSIEIDRAHEVSRFATRDIVAIRASGRLALKIGSAPWAPPEGPFAAMAKQLANPETCPVYKEGEQPTWRSAGEERLDGTDAFVAETVGDTALAYVQRVQEDGIASAFPDETARPKAKVLSYAMRAWVRKSDRVLLRQEKTMRIRLAMPGMPEVETVSRSVQVYLRYGEVEIQIPDEAKKILAPDAGKKKAE